MKVGTACTAFFCSCDGDLKGLCHGDDLCVVARQKQLQTFGKVLEKRFEVKQTGHIGFGANDKKELKILNRTIKIDVLNDEMTLEADTKLVENALESMKLNAAKGVDSPPVRKTEEQTAQIENSEKLTSAESTLYRSLVMKLAYVAQDRVDIAEAVKCLTRHMKEPRSGHMQELKRLGRYLVKNRRCVLTYTRQTSDATLQVHVDSDWAVDLLGTSLGVQSHYQDWMIDVPIQIYSDSSAATSVARRRGIGGRLRHLQTRHLWLQSWVALDHLKLDVVAGERNPADTLTKPLPGRKIREWSEHVGQRWLQQS